MKKNYLVRTSEFYYLKIFFTLPILIFYNLVTIILRLLQYLVFGQGILNRNPNKKVVAPSLWFPSNSEHARRTKLTKMGYPGKTKGYLYPEDWIILDVQEERKIPDDINDYLSTSENS